MIPSIQDILLGLQSGEFSTEQCFDWINRHFEIAIAAADLRDHFAGLAMQAAATNSKGADGFTFEQRAEWAYQQSDAMLKARQA